MRAGIWEVFFPVVMFAVFVDETDNPDIYTYGHPLSLHDAPPILVGKRSRNVAVASFCVAPPHIFDKCSHGSLASAAIVICRLAANKTETSGSVCIDRKSTRLTSSH